MEINGTSGAEEKRPEGDSAHPGRAGKPDVADLLKEHGKSLFRYIGWFFPRRQDALTVLGAVCLDIRRQWDDRGAGGENPSVFLYRLARQRVMREWRRRRDGASEDGTEVMRRSAAWENGMTEERNDSRALDGLIARAALGIPPAELEVYCLRDVQGLSEEEAAAVSGIPPAEVKERLHAQRSRLARAALEAALD